MRDARMSCLESKNRRLREVLVRGTRSLSRIPAHPLRLAGRRATRHQRGRCEQHARECWLRERDSPRSPETGSRRRVPQRPRRLPTRWPGRHAFDAPGASAGRTSRRAPSPATRTAAGATRQRGGGTSRAVRRSPLQEERRRASGAASGCRRFCGRKTCKRVQTAIS